jgi:hypothetical protein
MVSQPALFNLAAGNFYRSTESVAVERAQRGAREIAEEESGDGRRAFDPTVAAAAAARDGDESDPFSTW